MLKKFFLSFTYSPAAFDIATLILRLTFGILMIPHGYSKLIAFEERRDKFMSFLGLSPVVSLSLAIFAEVICAGLVTIGLFTRVAVLPLIITCIVITFVAHSGEFLTKGFSGFAYLTAYTALLLIGPGKYSLDYILFGKKK